MMDRFEVAGVPVSVLNMGIACAEVERAIETRAQSYYIFRDMNGIVIANADPAFHNAHVDAAFVAPDGMPLVWLGKLLGHRHVGRVYGPEFMLAFCARSQSLGYRHFFYGSTESVTQKLVAELRVQFPRLDVCGRYSPPFRAMGNEPWLDDVARIREAKPDIVWVGLGTPKQEQWMQIHEPHLAGAVLVGVGAAFDFNSKAKPQAPKWMQHSGLEWCFRLMMEPRRLGKRYLVGIPKFLWLIATKGCKAVADPEPIGEGGWKNGRFLSGASPTGVRLSRQYGCVP